jgi:hypothetical protein
LIECVFEMGSREGQYTILFEGPFCGAKWIWSYFGLEFFLIDYFIFLIECVFEMGSREGQYTILFEGPV